MSVHHQLFKVIADGQTQIKCDETKPDCRVCRTSNTQCPGYGKTLRWSNKHEVLRGSPILRRQRQRRSGTFTAPTASESSSVSLELQEQSSVSAGSATAIPTETQLVPGPTSNDAFQHSMTMNNVSLGPLWPDLEGCSYEDLGLSDNLLLELDLQYSHQEPSMSALQSEHNLRPISLVPNGADHEESWAGADRHEQPDEHDATSSSMQENTTADSPPAAESTLPGTKNSLLQTYYRLSKPGQVIGLSDESFVDYYFENVCSIFSCFDSATNPFRGLVEEAWTSSAALYLTIQSTAIGHLANYYPYLAPLGLEKRSQAWRYLQRDLQSFRIGRVSGDTLLMTLLLLGLSSSWHQASNLGMQYLLIARDLMQRRLQGVQSRAHATPRTCGTHDEFFEHALMYWEMLASFVDPVPLAPLHGQLQLPSPARHNRLDPIRTHSWTGVVPEVHFALAEVGRTLRRRRGPTFRPTSTESSKYTTSEGQWAHSLECFLLAVELPADDAILDYDDIKTPKGDLIALADAYRWAGLLEIYNLFPNLLEARLSARGNFFDTISIPTQTSESNDLSVWLVAIAGHILSLTKPIGITSGSCRLMPLLLVVAAGQFRMPDSNTTQNSTGVTQHSETIQARYLVEARMLVLSRKYPQRPLLQMLDIIKEVWQRLDNGDPTAHWLEVVHELGWQTMMG